jgi:DNA modification methylase
MNDTLISPTLEDKQLSLTNWMGSAVHSEFTFHQLSPFIGKIKSTIARELILTYSKENDYIYDPFSGSSTVPLEGWILGRNVIANDLSPYAYYLNMAKLNPYNSLEDALLDIQEIDSKVLSLDAKLSLQNTDIWVKEFYHPDTLAELLLWKEELINGKRYFLTACLMGILHHQRPGFLSYPSSHSVPYLRLNKYPESEYPEMYSYRPILPRLRNKVIRAYKRLPKLDNEKVRLCSNENAATFIPSSIIDTIITSPPYMKRLSYGRDNRLRLWLLGFADWQGLDKIISPKEHDFFELMAQCFQLWKKVIKKNGYCILVVDDSYVKKRNDKLHNILINIACETGEFSFVDFFLDEIPYDRRTRKNFKGSVNEVIIVLKNNG